MKHPLSFFTAGIAAIGLLLASGAFAQDAAKVDSAHYKVEFENDQVRVLRISYGPKEKSVMHAHPESVAIFLTDVKGQFTFPDGKSEEITAKAGQAVWTPALQHQPENLTDTPFELIQVELKGKATGKKDAAAGKAAGALDAVKLDPKHYKVEFENDRVRVLRIAYGPGEKSVMHGHGAGVAVFLNDVQGKFTFPDGKSEEITAKAGQAVWMPALQHLPENTGDAFELVQIEIKE